MKYCLANLSRAAWLAEWNHDLIRDEGHRNPMTMEWVPGDPQ